MKKQQISPYNQGLLIFVLVAIGIFSISGTASADIGPKPQADFKVTLEGEVLPDFDFNARLLICQETDNLKDDGFVGTELEHGAKLDIFEYEPEEDCYWRPSMLAWGGDCQNQKCHFNYHLPDKFRMAVYLPSLDQVFVSDIIYRKSFNSVFSANLLTDGSIEVEDVTPFLGSGAAYSIGMFFVALIISLILELFVALLYLAAAKKSKKILYSVLLANAISLPIVWFVIPLLHKGDWFFVIAGTSLFLIDALVIYFINRKSLGFWSAFVMCLVMNLVSFFIGGLTLAAIFLFIGFSQVINT